MKTPKILVNGIDLSRVNTPVANNGMPNTSMRMGRPVAGVREEAGAHVLELYPLMLAPLYFDSVLPQDRSVPVEVEVKVIPLGGTRRGRPAL